MIGKKWRKKERRRWRKRSQNPKLKKHLVSGSTRKAVMRFLRAISLTGEDRGEWWRSELELRIKINLFQMRPTLLQFRTPDDRSAEMPGPLAVDKQGGKINICD